MKVYVLIVESTIDYNTEQEIKVFANHKDAEDAFSEEVLMATVEAGDDWEIEESSMSFSIYEDGYYARNHIDVDVLEKEVIE
jgi:hypothetical protein